MMAKSAASCSNPKRAVAIFNQSLYQPRIEVHSWQAKIDKMKAPLTLSFFNLIETAVCSAPDRPPVIFEQHADHFCTRLRWNPGAEHGRTVGVEDAQAIHSSNQVCSIAHF